MTTEFVPIMTGIDPRTRHGDHCVHEEFEDQAERTPEAVALLYRDQQLKYGELNSRANQLGHHLQNLGVGPEVLVGLCLPRSMEAVVGILGILKAGGAYVPLDPYHPQQQLNGIVEDSHLSLVLTDTTLRDMVPNTTHVYINTIFSQSSDQCSNNVRSGVRPDNVVYVAYTSGSTGKPKGVVRIHRGLLNDLAWADFQKDDVCCLNLSLSVGFSVHRLFLPLISGVPLVIVSDDIAKDAVALVAAIERARITNIAFATSSLRQILNIGLDLSNCLSTLRTVTVGGTAVPWELIERFKAAVPDARVFNQYASTETGPAAIGEIIGRPLSNAVVSVRPIGGTKIHILDGNVVPVPDGIAGELYVEAANLARGYLYRPGLTADRFLPSPFATTDGQRLYRTGDRGRYLPDGSIEISGRIDNQVKIRGFRVELEGVEAVLSRHAKVEETIVTVQEIGEDKRLVAYILARVPVLPTAAELRQYALERLPNFMVPSIFVVLKHFPLTSTGKVDRNALPEPYSIRAEFGVPYEPPRTLIEAALAWIWADVLALERIGIHDRFLELGGDSLMATRVLVRIRDRLGLEVPLQAILEGTIAQLCEDLPSDAS
jgi:amino acid adenylation domain-containing protein